jgi:hypothetical protein
MKPDHLGTTDNLRAFPANVPVGVRIIDQAQSPCNTLIANCVWYNPIQPE